MSRYVSPTENIMLKVGPTYITMAVVLERPFDLAAARAQIIAIVERVPRLRSRFVNTGVWHRNEPAGFDVSNHLFRLDAPALDASADLGALLTKTRRLKLPEGLPPWYIVAVNASRPDASEPGGLPALLFHFNHAIADGIRAVELFTRVAEMTAADTRRHLDATDGIQPISDLHDLDVDERISDLPVVHASVPRADVAMAGSDPSVRISKAIAATITDETLFAQDKAWRERVALIRMTRRRADPTALGNHATAVAGPKGGGLDTTTRTFDIGREWQIESGKVFLSLCPNPLARRLTQWWYDRFDAVLTIVPAGRAKKPFAGPYMDQIVGLIPILADVPLSIAVISYNSHLHFSLIPQAPFHGSAVQLGERFVLALTEA